MGEQSKCHDRALFPNHPVFPTQHTGTWSNKEQHREFPHSITVSIMHDTVFTISFIKGIIKMILTINKLGTTFAVR